MAELKLSMKLLPECYGVCRLNSGDDIPGWVTAGEFFSITRTSDELSVVCREQSIPDDVQAEKSWRILKVLGPVDFSLTGILAAISAILAASQISIFAISTYDTDYILVKEKDIDHSIDALKNTGYEIAM